MLSSVHDYDQDHPEPSSSVGPIPSVMLTLASPRIQPSLPFTAANFVEARARHACSLSSSGPELPVCTHSEISPPFECVACEKQLAECKAWYERHSLEPSPRLGEETLHSKFREEFSYCDSGEDIDATSGALEVPVVQHPNCGAEEDRGPKLDSKVYLFPRALAMDPPLLPDQYRYPRAKGEDLPDKMRPSMYVQVLAKRLVAKCQRLVTVKLRSRTKPMKPLIS